MNNVVDFNTTYGRTYNMANNHFTSPAKALLESLHNTQSDLIRALKERNASIVERFEIALQRDEARQELGNLREELQKANKQRDEYRDKYCAMADDALKERDKALEKLVAQAQAHEKELQDGTEDWDKLAADLVVASGERDKAAAAAKDADILSASVMKERDNLKSACKMLDARLCWLETHVETLGMRITWNSDPTSLDKAKVESTYMYVKK